MSEKEKLDKYSEEIIDSVFEKIKNEDNKINDKFWFDESPPEEVIIESQMRKITLESLGITIYKDGKIHVKLRFDSPDFRKKPLKKLSRD